MDYLSWKTADGNACGFSLLHWGLALYFLLYDKKSIITRNLAAAPRKNSYITANAIARGG